VFLKLLLAGIRKQLVMGSIPLSGCWYDRSQIESYIWISILMVICCLAVSVAPQTNPYTHPAVKSFSCEVRPPMHWIATVLIWGLGYVLLSVEADSGSLLWSWFFGRPHSRQKNHFAPSSMGSFFVGTGN
jgi:hypothetical protein